MRGGRRPDRGAGPQKQIPITHPHLTPFHLLCGTSDANIPFDRLGHLLRLLGFDERIRGSHHVFTQREIEEILNLQPRGAHAKPYQVTRSG